MKGERLRVKGEKWLTRLFCVALLSSFLLPLFTFCSRDNACNTPFGEGGIVDINMPDFAALQNVGGFVTINRGYKGIFVRRLSYSDFVAFESACPNDHDVRLQPLEGWDGGVLECPDCHSLYETVNGQPLEGAASGCSLYQYSTYFDGYILTIY